MPKIATPRELLKNVSNDYSAAEEQYADHGGLLVDLGEEYLAKLTPAQRERAETSRAVLRSRLLYTEDRVPTVAIVVNVAERPVAFPDVLRTLACQSFVEERPDHVELIIVQDGADGVLDEAVLPNVREALAAFHPSTSVRAFRVAAGGTSRGRGTARNVGIWYANRRAQVIMFLDDALILDKHFVAEQLVRHKYITTPIALLGFKENRKFATIENYNSERPSLLSGYPDFRKDIKWSHKLKGDEVAITEGIAGFDYEGQRFDEGSVISYMNITGNFKALHGSKPIGHRALPMFFHTGLTSVTYRSVLEVGGFEEAFDVGLWGMEDSYLGLLLAIKQVKLVPCPSSVAYKVEIKEEEELTSEKFRINKQLHLELSRETFWDWANKKSWDSYNEEKLQRQIDRLCKINRLEEVQLRIARSDLRARNDVQLPDSSPKKHSEAVELRRPRYHVPKLFGVAAALSRALTTLRLKGLPSLISIEGLGGLGKTTLAQQATNQLLVEGAFETSAWYSVRQTDFDALRQGVSAPAPTLALTELLLEVEKQLGFRVHGTETEGARLDRFLDEITRAPFLIVIDNVETRQDIAPLLPLFNKVNQFLPSKIVVTSRIAMNQWQEFQSFAIPLVEIGEADSIELIRYQGEMQNLEEVTSADDSALRKIFEVVGGNPLALNLSVGLVRHTDLTAVISSLSLAKGVKPDALYHWIYWRLWEALSLDAKRVLVRMRRLGVDGADRARLEAVTEMAGYQLDQVIEELANMSLMMVVGPIDRRTHAIHRLTRTFLQEIAARWDQDKELSPFRDDDAAAARANLGYTHNLLRRQNP